LKLRQSIEEREKPTTNSAFIKSTSIRVEHLVRDERYSAACNVLKQLKDGGEGRSKPQLSLAEEQEIIAKLHPAPSKERQVG
jgi:hypothetical protein